MKGPLVALDPALPAGVAATHTFTASEGGEETCWGSLHINTAAYPPGPQKSGSQDSSETDWTA